MILHSFHGQNIISSSLKAQHHNIRPYLSTRSKTKTTFRPLASILLLPTASKTSSSGFPSTEYINRFVFGIPMPPANNCHVGVSIVVWHAVTARRISPCWIFPTVAPFPSGAKSSTVTRLESLSCPKTIPRGRGASVQIIRDLPA